MRNRKLFGLLIISFLVGLAIPPIYSVTEPYIRITMDASQTTSPFQVLNSDSSNLFSINSTGFVIANFGGVCLDGDRIEFHSDGDYWECHRPTELSVYAQISDNSTQTPSDLNPTLITFDTHNSLSGITHSNSTNTEDIIVDSDGIYQITIQPQFEKTSGGVTRYIDFWYRINDNDVENSNIRATIKSNSETDVIVSSFMQSLNANDVINVMMSVEATGEGLGIYPTSPSGEPTIPSIIFSIHRLT